MEEAARVVYYRAPRNGGNGELRVLDAALRAGTFGRESILARWNNHADTRAIRRVCKRLGISVEVVP